jgi:hypothetical protein
LIDTRYGPAWLTAKGFGGGSVSDGFAQYLQNKTGLKSDKNSMLYNLLGGLGYTQVGLNAGLMAFWAAKTGLSATGNSYRTLEQAFYATTSNDYA